MARRRPLENYPPTFLDIFKRGAEGEIVIQCSTSNEAKATRNQLYTYRYVLRDKRPDLAKIADTCSLLVKGDRIICKPRTLAGSEAIAAALKEAL